MEDGFVTMALINEADILQKHDIPGIIVQGRYDCVCPMKSAFELNKKWPKGKLVVVPDAGHSCKEPGIISELCKATDEMATIIKK